MNKFVIPTNNLQATIHLQGREAALDELLTAIVEHSYISLSQVMGEIHKMKDEIKEILE